MKQVILLMDGVDRGRADDLADANGKAYGVAVHLAPEQLFDTDDDLFDYIQTKSEPLERLYGPSENAAMHNAVKYCQDNGLSIMN